MATDAQIKTFVDGFSIATGSGDIQRKMLAHYVNVSSTAETPQWELLGYKVDDASEEFNWDSEKKTDITGVTYNTVNKSEPEISLDDYIVNEKSTFIQQLSRLAIRNAVNEFGDFDVLTVYGFMTDSNDKMLAKVEAGCTILPDSIGGKDYVHLNPTISLSNNATYGTVEAITKNPTFTEYTAS